MPPEAWVDVRVSDGGRPHLGWAEGETFRLPDSLLRAAGLDRHLDGAGRLRVPADLPEVTVDLAVAQRRRAAFTDRKPASSRLGAVFSYRHVPAALRMLYASAVGRWKRRQVDRWAAFPRWPLDLTADFLADLAAGGAARIAGPAPVILSHDLDSPEGLERAVRQFLPLEEEFGARSVNFIVPCAWPIDAGLLREVRRRGHEVGVHGYDHSNRTAFADPAERRRRLDAGRRALDEHDVRGYRAPSLLRTAGLLRDLADFYEYDGSIPTSGGPFPVPNNGCASARPFEIEGITEIPLSLPRDGSLRFLGHSPDEIAELWVSCADRIAAARGVVVLLTHCEARFSGNPPMLAAYRRFLGHVAGSGRFRWATPAEVLPCASVPTGEGT
jgi:peptidoglycan/xylan/chitin deacetylase (PgdA/CDA1 family)